MELKDDIAIVAPDGNIRFSRYSPEVRCLIERAQEGIKEYKKKIEHEADALNGIAAGITTDPIADLHDVAKSIGAVCDSLDAIHEALLSKCPADAVRDLQ